MYYEDEIPSNICLRNIFYSFVCATLTFLLAFEAYPYLWGPTQATIDADVSDMRHVILQLSHGLTEANHKYERLQDEVEKLSSALPAVAAAAGRARDALDPSMRHNPQQAVVPVDYDRQFVDYALESAGARILDTGDTVEYMIYDSPISWALHAIVAIMSSECLGARSVIRPESLPGECWAFRGTRGEVTIRLLGNVHIKGVSVEHIQPKIAPTGEISSAPRLFQLEGLDYRKDSYPHDFGTYEYDKKGKPIQYFKVLHPAPKPYSIVRVRVHSNWGNPVYTCVYRVRVHGELAASNASGDYTDLRVENE